MRRTLSSGIELAIGEGARAAEAKLDVAFGVKRTGLIEMGYGFGAALRIVATLNKQGIEAGFCKRKRTEQTSTSRSYNNRAVI